MISDAGSTRRLTRVRCGLTLAFALVLGLAIVSPGQSALAGVDEAREAKGQPAVAGDARARGAIVLAGKDGKGGKNWNKGNNNKNKNWSHNNKKWNNNNKNWSKNYNKHWGNGWSNYNNNWNKNWNKRAYVRNWNHRPYYGEFIGGIVLGSILAANGVGVVPYAPEPNLCWYWADPYMYRGYWDYCY
jgi:hypothetical protein